MARGLFDAHLPPNQFSPRERNFDEPKLLKSKETFFKIMYDNVILEMLPVSFRG